MHKRLAMEEEIVTFLENANVMATTVANFVTSALAVTLALNAVLVCTINKRE